MYKKTHDINLECITVNISKRNDLVSISNNKTLNVFKKNELFDEGGSGLLNPIYAINHQNDVVLAMFNNGGNYLGICDMDQILTVYDVDKDCNSIYKTDSNLCKFRKTNMLFFV